MNIVYGGLMAAVGLFMAVGGFTNSDALVYRVLRERSRSLWGDHVNRFYQVVGVALLVLGGLWAAGVIWA